MCVTHYGAVDETSGRHLEEVLEDLFLNIPTSSITSTTFRNGRFSGFNLVQTERGKIIEASNDSVAVVGSQEAVGLSGS